MKVGQVVYFSSFWGIDPVTITDGPNVQNEVKIKFPDGQEIWELRSALFEVLEAAQVDHAEQVRRAGVKSAAPAKHKPAPPAPREDPKAEKV